MLRYSFILIFSLFLIASCDRDGVFEENIDSKNNTWDISDIAKFGVSISDTINSHNILVNIRNTTDYPNSNLYLFITTYAPTGGSQRDTLECLIADDYGKWLGKGFGFIRDNRFPYKINVRFPIKGTYRFEIQQAMRTDQLEGIASVGLRVERNIIKK
jgi:gliding motility-associated lipoprotein GldH